MEVTNRFKGLDLIDRVPEELWTEVHDIVQEAVIKTILKKKTQKGKVLAGGGLTNGYRKKRSERQRRKGKIYPIECRVPMNSNEIRKPSSVINAKKIEENNRIGKTRDLFKKIRDTRGPFHAKMGSINDRNCMT